LGPIQERYYSLKDSEVQKILTAGAKKVTLIANSTLSRVKDSIGLG
jgi:hypothetical protein